jgi:hypothetical protein
MPDDVKHPTAPEDELVPEDDSVIGRAFRWSILVLLLVALVAVVGYAILRPAPVAEQVLPKESGVVPDLTRTVDDLPRVAFTDVTRGAGIRFVHSSGAAGQKLLPETMGGGAAFLDYDGDGDQDLLFVNSTDWPETRRPGPAPTMALYRNDGRGGFADVTREAGLAASFYGMGVAVGDYDDDGDPDVFLTALGPNHLYRNDGGRFVEVTDRATTTTTATWTCSSATTCAGRRRSISS